jgi:ribosomal protein S27AE
MCEDGLSTPIPGATYKFLKWLGADVYVARTQGTYFVMPKWSKKLRPGKTTMDIFRLFTKEELASMTLDEIREKTDKELLYDAYREQESLRVPYLGNDCVEGLENVLYQCPQCGEEFSVAAAKNTIYCSSCGFARKSDRLGFLHDTKGDEESYRYVSDWSRMISDRLEDRIRSGKEQKLACGCRICMVDERKHKFVEVGNGTVTLLPDKFLLEGKWNDGAQICKEVPIGNVPALPFSPGKYLEIQDGGNIYRCVLADGRLVMKFIHMVKIFYRHNQMAARAKSAL